MILLGAGSSVPFNVPTMQQFTEKFHETISEMQKELVFKKVEKRLSDLGSEGWELVDTIKGQLWIFKRKVVEIQQKENKKK